MFSMIRTKMVHSLLEVNLHVISRQQYRVLHFYWHMTQVEILSTFDKKLLLFWSEPFAYWLLAKFLS